MPGPIHYEEIEAIVRKGERDERRKRRQFGLAKLLAWTGVAALLLGLLRMIGVGPIVLASVVSWVAIIGGVRLLFGSPVALGVSIALGAMTGPGLVLVEVFWKAPAPAAASRWIPGLAVAAAGGGYAGYLSYVALEILFCLIGLPEGLLRADGYDRQGPM